MISRVEKIGEVANEHTHESKIDKRRNNGVEKKFFVLGKIMKTFEKIGQSISK